MTGIKADAVASKRRSPDVVIPRPLIPKGGNIFYLIMGPCLPPR
jgi:hypothetical protein